MSRRTPNPAAERAAANQITIKSLLKLETNKICADCKRNKHPRWASWNLGVFVCIRCSGIHRGMGTHISRVKSVDLDSWTDEQMQSILSWGNARANKYWEAKLAAGHAPSEGKIENFIRTKYELKRWVMDGPIPDPASLDADGDDDVPLSLVKEKQAIERKVSGKRVPSGASQSSRAPPAPEADLIGGDPAPQRSSTGPPASGVPAKAAAAPPKATPSNQSLLGLDFLGESAAPPRPASTSGVSTTGGQSRPDLKQSILSLYASAPRPQAQPQQGAQPTASFGGMPSPPMGHQQQGSVGGFSDAFSSLSMSGAPASKPPAADPFANLGSAASSNRSPPQMSSGGGFNGLNGGSFFDPKPAQQPVQSHQRQASSGGFGSFSSMSSPQAPMQVQSVQPTQAAPSSGMMDLFDFAAPAAQTTTSPPPANPASPPVSSNSVFNLSAPVSKPTMPSPPTNKAASPGFGGPGMAGADLWGGNAWGAAAAPSPQSPQKAQVLPTAPSNDFGWSQPASSFASTPIVPGNGGGFNPAPKVAADEEFGGWSSGATPTTGPSGGTGATGTTAKSGGAFGADEDLFSNVWQ